MDVTIPEKILFEDNFFIIFLVAVSSCMQPQNNFTYCNSNILQAFESKPCERAHAATRHAGNVSLGNPTNVNLVKNG